MDITVRNLDIVVKNPTVDVERNLTKLLSYTDSAKQYQVRRMAKNPFLKKKPEYEQMKQLVHGCLVEKVNGNIVIPAGFHHLVEDLPHTDERCDTGDTIALPWKTKPFDLRDYQRSGVDQMVANWRGLINFATGLGKTLTAIYAIRELRKKTLILCPGTGIADNFYSELCKAFGEHKVGYFGDGKHKIRDITVGIAASVNNHIDKFKDIGLGVMIVDEVHHVPADTFYTIARELGNLGRVYGLTATDFRSDGKDVMITAGVGDVLIRKDLIWGIKNKWLRDPYFIIRNVPTTGYSYRDNKLKNYKAHVLNSQEMTERIYHDIEKFIKAGMSVLCLVDEVAHGQQLSDWIKIPFATGKDKKSSSYIEQLNNGEIPGLIGTDSKIGEGVDTRNVDVLVLANFVAGKGRVWQCLGRGLRPFNDNYTLIVLDYCPTGSDMLTRHCRGRIGYYQEITDKIKII